MGYGGLCEFARRQAPARPLGHYRKVQGVQGSALFTTGVVARGIDGETPSWSATTFRSNAERAGSRSTSTVSGERSGGAEREKHAFFTPEGNPRPTLSIC